MTAVERLSDYPPDTARGLYILECDAFSDVVPAMRQLPGKHSVAFLISDFRSASLDDLTALSRYMIDAGARYFCAAGDGCKTAHLAFDLACCEFEADRESVILTTDHSCESLTDAIWVVINCAYPVDPCDRDWHATIAICVNDKKAAQTIRDAFTDPVEFSEHYGPTVDDAT